MTDEAIWQREEKLWSGDGSIYETAMAEDCLMQFPLPTGRLDAEGVRGELDKMPRWQNVEFLRKSAMQEGDTLMLIYEAKADRGEERIEPYHALAVTVWRGTGEDGKIIYHQQTPQTTPKS